MAWKSNWKRIFWNKFHFTKEQRRRRKKSGKWTDGKSLGIWFFSFFFIVEWQKKFRILTQWQLYKLNGGINYKMKLNDCTRKSDTFISLFGTKIRCTLQHVLFFCVPRVFFFARLFSHSFTHSSKIKLNVWNQVLTNWRIGWNFHFSSPYHIYFRYETTE